MNGEVLVIDGGLTTTTADYAEYVRRAEDADERQQA